ncbi:MAG: VOC family protein [Aquimonas sp.]
MRVTGTPRRGANLSPVDPNPDRCSRGDTLSNDVVHFAIHADDCERAKTFYQTVFGWSFQPWGPPDFWQIRTSAQGIRGALQKRRGPGGAGTGGYECSISVVDIKATVAAIEAAQGQLMHPPFLIERVGTVAQFRDTEGNLACVIQYEPGVLA